MSLRGEIGYGDGYGDTSGLPFFEDFFAGGVSSVRGYDDNTLGPKSLVGGTLEAEEGFPTTSRHNSNNTTVLLLSTACYRPSNHRRVNFEKSSPRQTTTTTTTTTVATSHLPAVRLDNGRSFM